MEIKVQLRWIVIPVLFVIAVASVYHVCHVAGAVDTAINMAWRITYGALFAVGFWSASVVLRKWMSHANPVSIPVTTRSEMPSPPIPTFGMNFASNGPGQYRVHGVDDETKFQITEVVYADSPSSAQLKVELKGVCVAAVERVG
jgi:hypothetical protein